MRLNFRKQKWIYGIFVQSKIRPTLCLHLQQNNDDFKQLKNRISWKLNLISKFFAMIEANSMELLGDKRVLSIVLSTLEKFGFRNLQIGEKTVRATEFWAVRYDTWKFPQVLWTLQQLASAGMIDLFRYLILQQRRH